MFEWIDSLSLMEAIIFSLIIVALNLVYIYGVKRHIEKLFTKTKSVQLTLNRLRILSQYTYLLLIAVSSFFITILFMSKLDRILGDTSFHSIIGMICSFLFIGILLTVNQLVLSKTTKRIRQTETTMKEDTGETIRGILFVFIPIIIVLALMEFIPEDLLGGMGNVLIPLILILFIPMVSSLFIGKMLKAYDMPESELKEKLTQFLEDMNIKDVNLYIWPTKKRKVANALVTGFTKKKQIYLSDYMLENMDLNEIKGILAHEIGHIKRNHLWKRIGIIAIIFILPVAAGYGMEWYEDTYHTSIPIWLGLTLIVGPLILGFAVAFNFFSRVQEREADEYVLQLGIDYRDFAAGLIKLAELNHMMTKMNKLDEKFQTHPSIARRVDWIINKANGSLEEFQNYRLR